MLRRLFGSRTTSPASRPAPCRLGVETLEPREVPTIVFGLVGNRVLIFDAASPQVILKSLPITGLLNATERILDIDTRTASGGLYGRSNQGRLYLINPISGFSLVIGSGNQVPTNSVQAGFDFDPLSDQIRVTTNTQQNLTINPNLATLINVDTPLAFRSGDVNENAPARVTGLAYSNNFVFPQTTVLYGIDYSRNVLVTVGAGSPADGQLTTVGGLGRDVGARIGFDIVTVNNHSTNVAYAAMQRPRQQFSGFYSINLTTGFATLIGNVGNRRLVTDIAVDIRNTSGFGFPTLRAVAGISGGTTAAPPALPPTNPNFAIGRENPGWFNNHDPIDVG